MNHQLKNVIFDLGGVLVDWNPRYLYRKIFSSDDRMEKFLREVCTMHWNDQQDHGRSFAEATAELIVKFPEYKNEILAYDHRWEEMISGPIDPVVQILQQIHKLAKVRLLGLSNWSHEKYPIAERRFPFLKLLEDVVVSGRIGIKKPDPRIFEYLCNKYSVRSEESLFIDDSKVNIETADQLGFKTIHFQSAEQLAQQLRALGVLA